MRIDLLLTRLRLAKSRSLAEAMVAEAHMRCNGRRVTSKVYAVNPGDVITMPRGNAVLVIEILALPDRRGPAAEAYDCYRVLDASASIALADSETARIGGKA